MPKKSIRTLQGEHAAAVRWDKNKTATGQKLAEARIAEFVAKVLETAPPLEADQRERLANLLRGGAA